jgi:hypothetical protein
MGKDFFLDVDSYQHCKHRQFVAGDVFLTHKIKEENRVITVLSDGLGSGIKASVLATLTASMAIKYISNYMDIKQTAEVIMDTLPVCKVRKISYSTFTIVDISSSGHTRVIEHGNPPYVLLRNGTAEQIEKIPIHLKKWEDREVHFSEFDAHIGDRIVFFSDGVSQAGMGLPQMPLGWGRENVVRQAQEWLNRRKSASARELARRIVISARQFDGYTPKDDISCGVMYLRAPRNLLVVTGPPFSESMDSELAHLVDTFEGQKVVCGGTTASIVARELDREINMILEKLDPEVPPFSEMDGVDLVTEGTLTLSKSAEILERGQNPELMKTNAATMLVSTFLDSDIIHFVIGTRINEAHQDPNLPVELDIRRNIIKKISHLLETKYLKEVRKRLI